MPLIEPERWKFGKRLMLQRFPCSTVIFFVCISVSFECLVFPSRLLLLSEPSVRRLSAHHRGIFQGSKGQGFQDDFSGFRQNGEETPTRPWLCSPMPNFAPINPTGQVQRENFMRKNTTNSIIRGRLSNLFSFT